MITGQNAEVVSRRDFYPFGGQISSTVGGRASIEGYLSTDSLRHKFTTYERDDETGLDFAQARYYGSLSGRFISPDPFLGSGYLTNPQSWNRYSYTVNNPLNIIDPSGLDGETPEDKEKATKQQNSNSDDYGTYYAPGQFQVGSGIPLFYEDPVVITAPADPIDFQHGSGEEFFKSYLEFAVINGVFNVVGAFSDPVFSGLEFVDDAGNVYNSANQALNAAKAGVSTGASAQGATEFMGSPQTADVLHSHWLFVLVFFLPSIFPVPSEL